LTGPVAPLPTNPAGLAPQGAQKGEAARPAVPVRGVVRCSESGCPASV